MNELVEEFSRCDGQHLHKTVLYTKHIYIYSIYYLYILFEVIK